MPNTKAVLRIVRTTWLSRGFTVVATATALLTVIAAEKLARGDHAVIAQTLRSIVGQQGPL